MVISRRLQIMFLEDSFLGILSCPVCTQEMPSCMEEVTETAHIRHCLSGQLLRDPVPWGFGGTDCIGSYSVYPTMYMSMQAGAARYLCSLGTVRCCYQFSLQPHSGCQPSTDYNRQPELWWGQDLSQHPCHVLLLFLLQCEKEDTTISEAMNSQICSATGPVNCAPKMPLYASS